MVLLLFGQTEMSLESLARFETEIEKPIRRFCLCRILDFDFGKDLIDWFL